MKRALSSLRPALAVGSIGMFLYLVRRTGPGAVVQNIRFLTWLLVGMVLLSGVRHYLRAVAWAYCVHTDGTRPSARQLLGPRLIAEALNDLTPAGLLLGEPAKVAAVSKLMSAQSGASSVILENLIYALGAVLFILSGIVFATVTVAVPGGLWWIASGLAFCLIACVAVVRRTASGQVLLLSRILDFIKRRQWLSSFLARHEKSMLAVEQTIYEFFLRSRRTFLVVLAIEVATNLTGIAEAYLFLKITTGHTSLLAAYLVESASRAVQFAFSFIPLGLGVQEGGSAATLQAVGYAAADGVSLAVIRKVRNLFWVAVGLALLTRSSFILRPTEASTT